MTVEFRTYCQEEAGFSLPLPDGWSVTERVDGCALVAVEAEASSTGFAPNVVVTVDQLADEESLHAWVQRSREALRDSLDRLRIIDIDQLDIDGRCAYRTLSHYLHPAHGGVFCEQWAVGDGLRGYVVSCSTAALDYDAWADVMVHAAEGLRLDGENV